MNQDISSQYLPKLHKEIIDIMESIHNLCQKHGLKYYIVGGTLLGAIRHEGFIPWDDDLDIGMPRDDFNKFMKICETELELPLKLQYTTTNEKYWFPFAKIENSNTVFNEGFRVDNKDPFGIFVDIFPLDDVAKFSKLVVARKWLISKLRAMIDWNLTNESSSLKKKLADCFTVKQLMKMINKVMSFTNGDKKACYVNFGSQYSPKKQTMPKEWYGDGVPLLFEGKYFIAPSKYDEVARSIYGDKYMELPPLEKRVTHHPHYVKFSDGTEIDFDREKKSI